RDLATSATTNRLEGPLFTYDPRGNLTAWGEKSFEYDALGMLTQVNFPASTSIFTADNERLCSLKHDPSTWNDEVFTLRDLDGRVLTMLRKQSSQSGEVTWTWLRDYVYRGPKLLAQETSQPSPEDRVHLHLDHLGSPRGLTDANGRGLASFHYYGYGERIVSATADRPMALKNPLQYTGHERDFHASWADDLDNMHARHYSPWLGRFLSVDPIDSSRLSAPQTWGKFVYGRNNPLAFVDPDGRESLAAMRFEQDARAVLSGDLTSDEFMARNRARAEGALTGASFYIPGPEDAVLAGMLASRLGKALSSQISNFLRRLGSRHVAHFGGRIGRGMDEVLQGATAGRRTAGKATQFEKAGGFDQARRDFDGLDLEDVRDLPEGRGQTGVLPDGRTVVLRPESKGGGPPTLEIQDGRKRLKIRYVE
ncbi:MAG: RHS repeat-associated core domain-containing protein, partial [Acidobacteriota bacterium]